EPQKPLALRCRLHCSPAPTRSSSEEARVHRCCWRRGDMAALMPPIGWWHLTRELFGLGELEIALRQVQESRFLEIVGRSLSTRQILQRLRSIMISPDGRILF